MFLARGRALLPLVLNSVLGVPLMPMDRDPDFSILFLSKKGWGVASDKKTEVIGALPDETVTAELGPRNGRKQVAFLREVLDPSPFRVEPRCPHVPKCGGCSLQQMNYFAQLDWKQEEVKRLFALSIKGGTRLMPILGCQDPWRYRNKMEFSFSQNRAGDRFLGLVLAGSSGRAENISTCHLVSSWYTELLKGIRAWWDALPSVIAYIPHLDKGTLRSLTVRDAKRGKGKMVILTVSGNPEFALPKSAMESFIGAVRSTTDDPHLSIFLRIHQSMEGQPTQFFEMHLHGPDHITEELHLSRRGKEYKLICKVSPPSFFQPNTLQAELLYSKALEMVSIDGATIYDLYCGSGTIGLAAAPFAKQVIGIELNPHAVFDAEWNAEENGLTNARFLKGDVGTVLTALRKEPSFTRPDVAIVDPPRGGLEGRAIPELLGLSPKEILYISCNPKTQAEDIAKLSEGGYRLKILQPVDQFPHTVHIENIAYLSKKG